MAHRNSRLSLFSRHLAIQRLQQGYTQATVAEMAGVSRSTIAKCAWRFREEGIAGLADHTSRPHSTPHVTPGTRHHGDHPTAPGVGLWAPSHRLGTGSGSLNRLRRLETSRSECPRSPGPHDAGHPAL